MYQRILLATHGNPTADAAVKVAAALAARHQSAVDVVAVLEPIPVFDAGFTPVLLPYDAVDRERADELRDRVGRQIARATGNAELWPIQILVGPTAPEIVEAARAKRASLIVMGIGHHAPADRIFGGETALRVSRRAGAPVFAAAPGQTSMPRRALAAVDFSESSLEAARTAIQLMDRQSTLTLAHVSPEPEILPLSVAEWERVYAAHVQEALAKLQADLAVPAGIRVNSANLTGNAARELLRLAQESNADLISAGSHGRNLVERLLVGSVATKLLRSAHCSVLLFPAARTAPVEEPTYDRWARSTALSGL